MLKKLYVKGGEKMASVFKRKRKTKDANGRTVIRQSKCWHIKYIDENDIERRIKAFTDKAASKHLASTLEKESALARAGVVDKYKKHRKTPLAEHLNDWKNSLHAKGNTEAYVRLTVSRATKVIQGCKSIFFCDITASMTQSYLAELRKSEKGLSAQSFNFYLQAIKQFCKWMVQNQRISESPLKHLKGLNVRTDRRHDRRTLELDEIMRLLEATVKAPKRFGMTGYERYLLYRFAAETGLRANEIRNLTVGCFDFEKLTVTAKAAYSKRRREDVQPIKSDTAKLLRDFFKGKKANVKALGGTCKQLSKRTSDMIKADLAATAISDADGVIIKAAIPYIDDAGRYADFHSLRHATGSLLAATGVHPKVAQSIMRHSNINLTMSRYTHTLAGQESQAIAGLPDLSLSNGKIQTRPGTDDSQKYTA